MRRALTILAVVVVVIVVGLVGVDTAFAINAERSFAKALMTSLGDDGETPALRYEPEITISGFPATRSIADGHYSAIGVTARAVDSTAATEFADARVPQPRRECRRTDPCHVDVRVRLSDVRVGGSHSMTHPFSRWVGLTVKSATTSTTLDSVAIGRLLGIDDLTINTPAPRGKAGGGGPQDGLLSRTTGVLMTGTVRAGLPDGGLKKVSVNVDLSAHGTALQLTATGFYDGPEEHSDAVVPAEDRADVLAQFSATISGIPMAWGATASSARSSGSDLMIEGKPDLEYVQSPSLFLTSAGSAFFMYTDAGKLPS